MSLRDLFPGYYRPSALELDVVWKTGVYVFDANVLLHIYRYSPATREELFSSWEFVGDRIWIPHQVAKEFQRNRLKVVSGRRERYKQCRDLLDRFLKDTENQLKKEFDSKSKSDINPMSLRSMWHEVVGYIDFGNLKKDYDNAVDYLEQREKAHSLPDENGVSDALRDRLDDIFGDNIGEVSEDVEQQLETAKKRVAAKIPPGFADVGEKDESREANDAVIWLQILDYAHQKKLPIIFVTSEEKEDWCWKIDKDTSWGAHPDLVKEMQDVAGVKFVLCSPKQFMKEVSAIRTSQEKLEAQEKAQREADIQAALAEAQAIQDEENSANVGDQDRRENDTLEESAFRPSKSVGGISPASLSRMADPVTGITAASMARLTDPVTGITAASIARLTNPLGISATTAASMARLTDPMKLGGVNPAMMARLTDPMKLGGMNPAMMARLIDPVGISPTIAASMARLTNPIGIGAMSAATMARLTNPMGVGAMSAASLSRLTDPVKLTGISAASMTRLTNPMGVGAMSAATMGRLTNPMGVGGITASSMARLTNPFGTSNFLDRMFPHLRDQQDDLEDEEEEEE